MTKRHLIPAACAAALLALTLTACANGAPEGTEIIEPEADNTVTLELDDTPINSAYLVPRTVMLKDGTTVNCILALTYSGSETTITCDWDGAK